MLEYIYVNLCDMITGVRGGGCEEMDGGREEKEPDRLMERYGGKGGKNGCWYLLLCIYMCMWVCDHLSQCCLSDLKGVGGSCQSPAVTFLQKHNLNLED